MELVSLNVLNIDLLPTIISFHRIQLLAFIKIIASHHEVVIAHRIHAAFLSGSATLALVALQRCTFFYHHILLLLMLLLIVVF